MSAKSGDELRLRHSPHNALGLGFAQVLHAIVRDPRISAEAFRLYCHLLEYAQQKDACWPGVERLARVFGVGRDSVSRWFDELIQAGYVSRERRVGLSSITWIEDVYANQYLIEHVVQPVLAERDERRRKNPTTNVGEIRRRSSEKPDDIIITTEQEPVEEEPDNELAPEPERVPVNEDGEEIVGRTRSMAEMCDLERTIIAATGGRGQLSDAQRKRINTPFVWPDAVRGAIGVTKEQRHSPASWYEIDDDYKSYVVSSIATMNGKARAGGSRHVRRESVVTMCCNYIPGGGVQRGVGIGQQRSTQNQRTDPQPRGNPEALGIRLRFNGTG